MKSKDLLALTCLCTALMLIFGAGLVHQLSQFGPPNVMLFSPFSALLAVSVFGAHAFYTAYDYSIDPPPGGFTGSDVIIAASYGVLAPIGFLFLATMALLLYVPPEGLVLFLAGCGAVILAATALMVGFEVSDEPQTA
jgi:hypothetical protein